MNQSTLDRIESLEGTVASLSTALQNIIGSKATDTSYGLAKVSEATTVTETNNGLVLSAKEKNPAVEGSLSNLIKKAEAKIPVFFILSLTIPSSATEQLYYTPPAGCNAYNTTVVLTRALNKGNGDRYEGILVSVYLGRMGFSKDLIGTHDIENYYGSEVDICLMKFK